MPTTFRSFAAEVRPFLAEAFRNELGRLLDRRAPGLPDPLPGLAGGKMIRGTLLCLVAAALGADLNAALSRAVAVELIQTASLIHDDFIDRHRTRRGLPALWTCVGPRRAVLLGDLLFSSALFTLSEIGPRECGVGSRAIARLACGAWREPADAAALLREGHGGGADYEEIIALKTGILFAAACELGALAAGAGDAESRRWRRYGLKIGQAYQLADDLHEMEYALAAHEPDVRVLTDLAPALLFFVPQSRTAISEYLDGTKEGRGEKLRPHVLQAVGLMKSERTRRLREAAAQLDELAGSGSLIQLVRRAPFDLIEMFDGDIAPASGGTG